MKLLIASALLLTTTAYAAPKAKPPTLFAKFFVEGASWTFNGEHVEDEPNAAGTGLQKKRTKDKVTCEMTDVEAVSGGWRGSLTCDGRANGESATYVATTAGLWRVDYDWDGETKSLDRKKMLIRATPKEEKRESGNDQDGYQTYLVKKHRSGWCFADLHSLGDESGWMLCISAAKGLIGGNNFTAGGFVDDFYYGDTPRW